MGSKESNQTNKTNSISKIFKPNCVCLLTNEWYITYQTGFSYGRLGQGLDLGVLALLLGWGEGGVKKYFFEIQPNFWCVSYSHEWHVQQHNFFGPRPLGPWGGAKRSNIIKFQLRLFHRFLNQTLYVTNERYNTYEMGFSSSRLCHAPGLGLGGAGGSKI